MIVALTITSAVACAILVGAEARGRAAVRVAAKLTASAAFVAIGVLALGNEDPARATFVGWIAGGLVLGAIGDAALLGHGRRWFLAGLVAFLFGHLAYVVAVASVVPPATWLPRAGGWALVPAVAGAGVAIALWPRLGRMRGPVLAYVVTIVTMVIAAIALARADDPRTIPAPQHVRFVIGAALFFVSDVAVARDRFVARAFANKAWGLPAYYAGQLCIAWSVVGL